MEADRARALGWLQLAIDALDTGGGGLLFDPRFKRFQALGEAVRVAIDQTVPVVYVSQVERVGA